MYRSGVVGWGVAIVGYLRRFAISSAADKKTERSVGEVIGAEERYRFDVNVLRYVYHFNDLSSAASRS